MTDGIYRWVSCPDCGSTDVRILASWDQEVTFECRDCGLQETS